MTVTVSNKRESILVEPIGRTTVSEYHEMIDAGILSDEDRVELLEGELVEKMPRNPPHDLATFRCQKVMYRILPPDWICFGQSAITMSDSEPEPDLAIVRGPDEQYATRHPGPDDMALVIEVADSTLVRDRGLKARVYARAGVPVYWIVNIPDRQLEVYTEPTGPETEEPHYRERRDFLESESVTVTLDGMDAAEVAVRELMP